MGGMEEAPRQLTARAIATGFLLGSLLAPCNIYTGLKIGFSFNMSIAAALLSYAFWNGLHRLGRARHWGLLENNINQTAASSAASILSAGLVAPIPAYTLISGQVMGYPVLVVWVFGVSFAGIVTALAVRRQLLERDGLPFPNGVATAETIREIYGTGTEAVRRIRLLLGAGLISGAVKAYGALSGPLPSWGPPAGMGFRTAPQVAEQGVQQVSWRALGIEIQPSLLLFGFGAIVGPRVGISLLLGTILGWILLPERLLAHGWVAPAGDGISWYETLLEWLLWPGVSLMAAAALTSFALSMMRIAWLYCNRSTRQTEESDPAYAPGQERHLPLSWLAIGCLIALVIVVAAQMLIFEIPIWLGLTAFVLSFLLAIIAGRVSGETGIPPIGALGKITQVTFGFLAPGNTTTNLMTANVTGGAAGQCSDLLHDLKTGKMIGANVRAQVVAQVFGIIAGSLSGCAAYMVLIPDPANMLLTPEWPAPAVATWKAVAEVLAAGLDTIPEGTEPAVIGAALIGVLLAIVEGTLPRHWRAIVPSASSVGFAFIIPPFISLALFLGAMARVIAFRINREWSRRYVIVIAAGLVAGESLAGVAEALVRLILSGGG